MTTDTTRQGRDRTAAHARSAGDPSRRKGPHRRLDRAGHEAKSAEKVAQTSSGGIFLDPDRAELARFVDALFLHAEEGGTVSVRAFYDDKRDSPPFDIVSVPINGAGLEPVIASAYKVASKAARTARPVVVAPPVATFDGPKADEASLREGLALSVELDSRAAAAVAFLRDAALGPPTLTVASGGEWTNPETGEVEPKLHVHWRLKEPTRTPEEHARLKRARALACELVGADGTAKTAVHPMRWAGTVHRKDPDRPKLCRIVEETPEAEIVLEDALAELEGLAILRGQAETAGQRRAADPTGDPDLLLACAELIPNADLDWDTWNRFGMAFFRASHGSEAGFRAFDRLSAKSKAKYDPGATRDRWEHYRTSPPSSVGAGTLVYEARRIDPTFRARRAGGEGDTPGAGEAIRLEGGELHTIVAAAAAALGKATRADPFNGFYRRGKLLVHTARLADEAELQRGGVRRARGALVIAAADPDALRVALTAAARWEKYDGRQKAWVPADAPGPVAKALLATAADQAEIPILTGIVEAATLRPDGTVLDRPGYDPATGLLFDPGGVEFSPIPENPTREQAEAALAKLREIVRDFPFLDSASAAVAIAALMAPQTRKACRAAPLHAFTAPKMASGKTLLATLPGYIATGRAPALMPPADDPAEERKRLLGVLMEGQAVNVFDNIEGAFKSDALCIVLTEPTFTDRILGVNGKASPSTACSFFATGNNLAVVGDLSARTVSCALDPVCERPEEREFEVNLHEAVPRRRGELAAAVLTIVRAYIAAGEPKVDVPNFARFESWSRFVRKPLVWLGMADPCAGRERVEGRDTERAQLWALLEAWRENFPGEAATVAEAIRLATRDTRPEEPEADIERRQMLHEALQAACGDSGKLSSRSIGKLIAKHENRIEGGLRFVNGGKHAGIIRWLVAAPPGNKPRPCGGFGGFGGFGGAQRAEMPAAMSEDDG